MLCSMFWQHTALSCIICITQTPSTVEWQSMICVAICTVRHLRRSRQGFFHDCFQTTRNLMTFVDGYGSAFCIFLLGRSMVWVSRFVNLFFTKLWDDHSIEKSQEIPKAPEFTGLPLRGEGRVDMVPIWKAGNMGHVQTRFTVHHQYVLYHYVDYMYDSYICILHIYIYGYIYIWIYMYIHHNPWTNYVGLSTWLY